MKATLILLLSLISSAAFSQNYFLLDEHASDKRVVQKFIELAVDNEMIKENPVIVVNAEVVNDPERLNQLDFYKTDITEMTFIPKYQAETIKKYGSKAINGVISISTRPFYAKPVMKIDGRSTRNVLFIVDGKAVSEAEFQKINPDQIESLAVIKNKVQIKKYTDKDYDGIIKIKLKN